MAAVYMLKQFFFKVIFGWSRLCSIDPSYIGFSVFISFLQNEKGWQVVKKPVKEEFHTHFVYFIVGTI